MTPLTLIDLTDFCKRAAGLPTSDRANWQDIFSILDEIQLDFFRNLYNTGLRFHELQDPNNWEYNTDSNIICHTLKGSNDRIFNHTQLTDYFLFCLQNDTPAWETCRYATTNRWLKLAFAPYTLLIDSSTVTTHIFRHRIIKQMAADGYTTQQISDYIGEVDNKNTDGYKNSIIFFP